MQEKAALLDRLTGELIGLARATDGNEHLISESSTAVIRQALAAGLPGSGVDAAALAALLGRVEEEKRKMVPNCFLCASPCGRTSAFDMNDLKNAEEDVQALKQCLLSGIRDLALCRDLTQEEERFFYKALVVIGLDGLGVKELSPIARELEAIRTKHTQY